MHVQTKHVEWTDPSPHTLKDTKGSQKVSDLSRIRWGLSTIRVLQEIILEHRTFVHNFSF